MENINFETIKRKIIILEKCIKSLEKRSQPQENKSDFNQDLIREAIHDEAQEIQKKTNLLLDEIHEEAQEIEKITKKIKNRVKKDLELEDKT